MNALAIIRSLIIYGLCLPLAIALGYLIPSSTVDLTSFMMVLLVVFLPLVPILLRWHHLVLIASWNLSAVMFFLPGRPYLWVLMALISLLLSLLQHILNREHKLIYVPSVARPLFFLLVVVVVTAALAGGIGMRVFGSEMYGGRRYVMLLMSIVGFFAIACNRVPPGREILYVSIFLLSGVTSAIGSMGGLISPSFYWIFAIFPVDTLESLAPDIPEEAPIRLGGLGPAAGALIWYLLARHGLRGVFSLSEPLHLLPFRFSGGFQVNQPWRTLLVMGALWVAMHTGFRSAVIFFCLMFFCHFFVEGLHRSMALPFVLLAFILGSAVVIPLASKMPLTVQRAISFLPVDIDPMVRMGADASTEWRLRMWREVIPQVPRYFLVGKGYAINPGELEMSERMRRDVTESAMLAGDYHNGPLTLLIPLGVWGAIAFLWFIGASFRVLYRNLHYGEPALRRVNTFLFVLFLVHVIIYFFVFGSFFNDLYKFTGLVALSISVNGGVREPARVEAVKPAFPQLRLARARS